MFVPTKSHTMKLMCLQWQWSEIYTKWKMWGSCCNVTITWQKPLSIPWGRPKKDLSWPPSGFQSGIFTYLVLAVSLIFLISIDFLSNASSYTDWRKAWNLCDGPWGHASKRLCSQGWSGPKKTQIASSWGKLPLLVYNQRSQQELLERPQSAKKRALFRMVHEDCFKSARAFTERMRYSYGVGVGRKPINKQPTCGQRKPLLTASHRRLHLHVDWARRWQKLTVTAWCHVIWGDESRFQLYPVNGRMRVRRLLGVCFQKDCQAARFQTGGCSVHV